MLLLLIASICALPVVLLIATYDGKDYGRCLATERYTYSTPVQVGSVSAGNVAIPIYAYFDSVGERCTRWEFPEGRPAD